MEPTLEPHCQTPLSAVSICSPHSWEWHQNAPTGLSDFPMGVLYLMRGESGDAMRGELAKWCSSRLIVLFLSSFNSGSLGIEFKWVTWRARHRRWIVVTVPSSAAGPSSLDANSELRTQAPMDQFFTHQLWSRVLIWPGPPPATADTGTLVWVMINISSLSVPLSGLSYDQHIPTQCPTHCLLHYSLTPPFTHLITSLLLVF